MPEFLPADEYFLADPSNRERDPLSYAVQALQWLVNFCEANPSVPWVRKVDGSFLSAARVVLEYFDQANSAADLGLVATSLADRLATWRGDFDPMQHPLAELGRVFRGDPGGHLEYPGPVFTLTMNDVLEGLTVESIVGEWDLAYGHSAVGLFGLATIVLAAIAEAAFLARNANGTNLQTELARVFSKSDNRLALRGQLANLVLAGQAMAWGCRVSFIPEQHGKTPDWSVEDPAAKLWVECTSRDQSGRPMNDRDANQAAIVRAWQEKRGKFVAPYSPGLISVDVSGLFVSREYGTILKRDPKYLIPYKLDLPSGQSRTIGVYNAASDLDMMVHESHERQMVGVAASALHSAAAVNAGILGLVMYHGQEFVVDVPPGVIARPQRGVLVWKGSVTDPEFPLAMKLAQPPIPLPPTQSAPPVFAFLV